MSSRPLSISTADGLTLEAEVTLPDDPWARVVLAHPHPQFGGNMRSLVTGALFSTLGRAGVAVLRFNFRGVERSEGTHDEGEGEALDIVAGIDALATATDAGPLVLSGWSFGAAVALAVVDQRLDAWFLVAPPLRDPDVPAAADPRPKLLAVPEHDQFCPPDKAEQVVAGWTSTTVEVIGGADHFCAGRTDRLAQLLETQLRSLA